MRKIIIVRHGETLWNKELRYQGQTDIELNETGIRQAQLLAERLKKEKISAVYSSDLKRAYKTAQLICKYHNVKIKKTKYLREIHYGVWEGMLLQDVKEKYPDILRKWWEDPQNANIPGAEPPNVFIERIRNITDKIISQTKGNVLIVTHGGPIKIMIVHLLGIDLSCLVYFRQDNTSLNIIEIDGERRVLTLMNDTCHLSS